MEELIAQYTGADEDSRLTRQYIARIEYDTTMRLLSPLIEVGTSVCELGAATGRYSLEFARNGANVTAVELAPDQVDILKTKSLEQNLNLSIHQGDACAVPFVESSSQDVCVVLGPLYHLKSLPQRKAVLAEAHRILKPNGVLAVAYISRFFVAGMFAQKFPNLVTDSVFSELRENGTVSDNNADSFFKVGYFAEPQEIEKLICSSGFSKLDHAATDSFSRLISAGVNEFTPEQYQTWLSYHLSVCKEPSLLGASNHGLVIARKTS